MTNVEELEDNLLNNFENYLELSSYDCLYLPDLRGGYFLEVVHASSCEAIFKSDVDKPVSLSVEDSIVESLEAMLEHYVQEHCSTVEKQLDVFSIGVASLGAFLQSNWTGPNLALDHDTLALPWFRPLYKEAATVTDEQIREQITACLILDGESCSFVKHQELLLLARIILKLCAEKFTLLMTCKWWWMRCLFTHQQILDEHSETLYNSLKAIMDEHLNETLTPAVQKLMTKREREIQFRLEAIRIYLYYSEVVPAKHHLQLALQALRMTTQLVGVMGKRTRYQQQEYAQLTLKVSRESQEEQSVAPALSPGKERDHLPANIALDDDTRLNQIEFSKEEGSNDEGSCQRLLPLEHSAVIAKFSLTQRSQPKDKLADEELMAYITCMLSTESGWCHQMFSLLARSQLESNHRRTVERAMQQVKALVISVSMPQPDVEDRLRLLFCSYLPHRWAVEAALANLFMSLGATNSALEIYHRLQRWEDVIGCYNLLQLRHKAAEIIQIELDKKETVKLWCLLGDATDDVECYRKAWELSGKRSARAQRHWALYFFHRRQYAESIGFLRESLSINSLQISLWFMLGFAAMDQEQWELCASAYRRYTNLDPDSFEAWNNLGKAYVNLGEKTRAWATFHEATKCNFESWQVWDNLMVVSVDCCEYEEVIRAYHRLLDLKGKHVDERVLEILVTAVVNNLPDNSGQPSGLLRKKALGLMGRITGQVTTNSTLWRLYADLTASVENQTPETLERTAQYLQRAHRAATQSTSWETDVQSCLEVMKLCGMLVNSYLECCKKCPSPQHQTKLLNSVKFSLQGVITRVKKEHFDTCDTEIRGSKEFLAVNLQTMESQLEQILGKLSDLQLHHSSS